MYLCLVLGRKGEEKREIVMFIHNVCVCVWEGGREGGGERRRE